MLKRITTFVLIIIFYLLICNIIYNTNKNISINKILVNKIIYTEKDKPIGKIIIHKIKLKNDLYNITSKHNNVEENVTILKESVFPTYKDSIMFIAAHSGTGELAYFKDLDKLSINDEIILIINKNTYKYIITEIWEDKKDGYIYVDKDYSKQLVLTTCSPTKANKQLLINSKLKESN